MDVEDVKKFARTLPVFGAAVGFFAIYAQVRQITCDVSRGFHVIWRSGA